MGFAAGELNMTIYPGIRLGLADGTTGGIQNVEKKSLQINFGGVLSVTVSCGIMTAM